MNAATAQLVTLTAVGPDNMDYIAVNSAIQAMLVDLLVRSCSLEMKTFIFWYFVVFSRFSGSLHLFFLFLDVYATISYLGSVFSITLCNNLEILPTF